MAQATRRVGDQRFNFAEEHSFQAKRTHPFADMLLTEPPFMKHPCFPELPLPQAPFQARAHVFPKEMRSFNEGLPSL